MNNTKLIQISTLGFLNDKQRTHPHVFRIVKKQRSSQKLEEIKRKSVQIDRTLQAISKPYLKTQLKDFLMKSQHQFIRKIESRKYIQLPQIITTNREIEERRPPSIRKIEQNFEEKNDLWSEIKVSGRLINTRAYHSTVFFKDSMYIFGGRDNTRGSFGDVSKLDRTPYSQGGFKYHWSDVQTCGKGPEYLSGHSSVVLGNKMFVFGGRLMTIKNNGELFALNLETYEWEIIKTKGDKPIPVDGHTMVPYYQTKAIVFGGFNPSPKPKSINNIQIYDYETSEWKILPSSSIQPRGRAYHSATMVVRDMWIYSGMDGAKRFSDLWCWNEENEWREIKFTCKGPGVAASYEIPRFGHISFNDGSHIFIFSGSSNALCEKNDLWSFNIEKETWTLVENGFEINQTENMKEITRVARDKIQRGSIRKDQMLVVEETSSDSPIPSERNLIKLDLKKNRALETFIHQYQKQQLHFSKLENISSNDINDTKDHETKQLFQEQDGDDKLLTYHKKQFLSSFDMGEEEQKRLLVATPTTQQMRQSIISVENPINNRQKTPHNKFHQMLNVANKFMQKKNVRPLPRDGATIVEGFEGWILFGGDRYKVTFNDTWLINRDELIKYAD